jgi:putative protease
MKRKIELLAPGGDIDSIKAAIVAGADAVYCGLNKFNARNRAANISFDDLQGILRLAHRYHCEVFLTLNILIVDPEIPAVLKLLNKLVNTGIDGVIVQDLGLFYLLSEYFKGLKIHASTQFTTHNTGQILFLEKLNAKRVNLSRELNIDEIKVLTVVANKKGILTEVFVHGSYCISFSGICYMSSVHGGNSGNRGRCSQPCRDKYVTTAVGINYPLNLKDNSAYFDLMDLYDAGVYSLKIEGRIKEFEYVHTVVKTWKNQIRSFYDNNNLINDNSDLYKVFNRNFSNSFLRGDINKDMFIDNPMSHSTKYLSEINNYSSNDKKTEGRWELYEEKEKIRLEIKNEIDQLSIAKIPLILTVSGQSGHPLRVQIKTPDTLFEVLSESNLADKGTEVITEKMILARLKAINDTEFFIEHTAFEIYNNLYLPFKELTSVKKRILFILNASRDIVDPVSLPVLKKHRNLNGKPELSVLISSDKEMDTFKDASVNVYFQLPNSFKNKNDELIRLFKTNKTLIPWFPTILIADDYSAAIDFLEQVKPEYIVTNNTGIAFEACERGISWIAGPFLNVTNSYSLLCLKEKFNCSGAFLSNELSEQQLKVIKKPENFHLYYSIFHPIVLMTSRQCLFHQVNGCEKSKIEKSCIEKCERTSTITNLKKSSLFVKKSKGNYHEIYNSANLLNTNIVRDMPDLFSGFMIDLRDIKTETKMPESKSDVIRLFENYLNLENEAEQQLKDSVNPSINSQYKQGI